MLDFRWVAASISAAALLGASGCASTADETEMAANQDEEADVICRRVHEVGSRVATRRCMSRAEWEAEAQEARDSLERNSNNRSVDPFTPGGPSR